MGKLRARREKLAEAKRAVNTRKAYDSDWKDFSGWAKAAGRTALPASPETVALYVAHLAERRKPSTAARRLAAISAKHRAAGYLSPVQKPAREVLAGARRERAERGEPASEQKEPLTVEQLRAVAEELGRERTAIAARDRAVILVGFASALRRSNLCRLELADVRLVKQGMVLKVRRSKTDQDGNGVELGIPLGRRRATCPVRALRAWLEVRGRWQGPLFCRFTGQGEMLRAPISDDSLADIVKRAVARIGLDPARYAGHSLRAGCATAAAESGVPETVIMQRTGHRSVAMVAKYVRKAGVFGADPLKRVL